MTNTTTSAPLPHAGAAQAGITGREPRPGSRGFALHLEHQDGPHGGAWAVRDDAGEQVFTLGRRPRGAHHVVVRDREGAEQASLGDRVLSLVEHYTVWHGGRPAARIYRPGAHRGHWFVEAGDHDGWVVLADHEGLRVLSGGLEVARLGRRDPSGMPTRVELAPGTDAVLVLLLADLLCSHGASTV